MGRPGIVLWCVASFIAAAHAQTLVIPADKAGHAATVKIPVGAVTHLSAKSAESLTADSDRGVESMRLRGDVLIDIAGSYAPIEIRADEVVLELTPDSRAEPAAADGGPKAPRSATSMPGRDGSQVFVGNVVLDLQTTAGPAEIKAERVEQQLASEPGA